MRRPRLATLFALSLTGVMAIAMAAYAVMQRYLEPNETWLGLGMMHGWHVVLLGLLLFLSLVVGFDHLVERPLRRVEAHLYKVATGRLEFLDLQVRTREIGHIVDSVNLMVRRMRLGAGDADPHRTALALRDVARRLRGSAPEVAEAMIGAAAALELLAPAGTARSGDGPSPVEAPPGSRDGVASMVTR